MSAIDVITATAEAPASSGAPDVDLLDRAPLHAGRVVLAVRDLDLLASYYRQVIGLAPIGRDGDGLHLGAGGRPLLTLRPGARVDAVRCAGLYHVAFLLPGRGDLGAWLAHVTANRFALSGAADHHVSDAVYLSDPEGNGIEITADRPSSSWYRPGRFPEMGSAPVDAAGLLRAAAGRRWSGMPDAGRVGHVHLRVADVAAADGFYAGLLGLDSNPLSPTAHFYGAGGYHHQIGVNCWQSRGAPPRREGATGLVEMQLVYRDAPTFAALVGRLAAQGSAVHRDGRDLIVADPDGIAVRLTPP